MKNKDPRDTHFITSRICGICGDNHADLLHLRAEHGLRHEAPDIAEWIVDLGEAAEYDVRPQHLPGQPGGVWTSAKRWSGRRIPACGKRRPKPRLHTRETTAIKRSQTSCALESVRRRALPRDPADEPDHPRDVLLDGGSPRSSFDFVSGWRWHGAFDSAFHGLPHPAHEVRRIHETGCASARRSFRFLLRGFAGL